MSPQGPKTDSDEKIENNFNGIVMTMLGILAVVLLLAIFFIYRHGSSEHSVNTLERPTAKAPAAR